MPLPCFTPTMLAFWGLVFVVRVLVVGVDTPRCLCFPASACLWPPCAPRSLPLLVLPGPCLPRGAPCRLCFPASASLGSSCALGLALLLVLPGLGLPLGAFLVSRFGLASRLCFPASVLSGSCGLLGPAPRLCFPALACLSALCAFSGCGSASHFHCLL